MSPELQARAAGRWMPDDGITIAGHKQLVIAGNDKTGAVLFGRGVVQLDHFTSDFEPVRNASFRAWLSIPVRTLVRPIDRRTLATPASTNINATPEITASSLI